MIVHHREGARDTEYCLALDAMEFETLKILFEDSATILDKAMLQPSTESMADLHRLVKTMRTELNAVA